MAALCVSGCTGREPEVAEPSGTPSGTVNPVPSQTAVPTPTPSPDVPAPPDPPADLARTDEVGAMAAAEHFVSLYAYTMQTGDTGHWSAMSAESCGFCIRIRDDAERMAANGDSYEGGAITLSNLTVSPLDEATAAYPVDASFTQTPVRHTAKDGSVLTETDGDSGVVLIDVTNAGGQWRILSVVVEDAR
jgi:hypothetical protein